MLRTARQRLPLGVIQEALCRHGKQRGGNLCLSHITNAWFSTTADDEKRTPTAAAPVDLSQQYGPLPGLALSASTAAAGIQAASMMSSTLGLPVSGIPVAIVLGMAAKNSIGYPDEVFQPGIKYATKIVLQGGIVAVAAKLSFVELLSTGSHGIPVVAASLGAGLLFIPMAGRLAGLPRDMSLLLAAGTSICGVTAITALAPAINASNRSLAVAVANTVAFGTVGMLAYPYLFNMLCDSSEQVGVCLGVAIHDTAQVLGSAMSYRDTFDDETALKVATVTKLTRNLGLAFAIPGLTYLHSVETSKTGNQEKAGKDSHFGLNSFTKFVPPFLFAFVGMSAIRSTGDLFIPDDESFQMVMDFIGNDASKWALGTAMAGVGLSTSASALKGVGWKPFAVGGAGALAVGGTGFCMAQLLL